ncbi:MAG: hypothetical protein OEU09_00195 [Rhodospirillales bacterium]|nr:hypothetical protein [Rhodospirillales bacterium]MDH3965764.1 hypothetical protein [Rhodospirillales bacterium]
MTDWQPAGGLIVPLETWRGFTGHEHLDKLGLIHMNGRVYDPVLGRFLSADPTVQFPKTTQGFNRYSYVLNNPLSFTDPSGFGIIGAIKKVMRKFTKFLHRYGRVLMSVAAAAGCGGNLGCSVLVAAFTSGMWTASYGGSLTDVVTQSAIAAGTALAFHGIGKTFGDKVGFLSAAHVKKIVAHGVVGAVSTALRGGKAVGGFLAGAFAQLAAPAIGYIGEGTADYYSQSNIMARTAAAAVAGGLGAVLGGGKFKNGAITGAFSRLFNEENAAHRYRRLEDLTRKEKIIFGRTARAFLSGVQGMSDEEIYRKFDLGGKVNPRIADLVRLNILYSVRAIVVDELKVYGWGAFQNLYVMPYVMAPLSVSSTVAPWAEFYLSVSSLEMAVVWLESSPTYTFGCNAEGVCAGTSPQGGFKY